jgi:neurotransmitter:Na+ symporter, NSS family
VLDQNLNKTQWSSSLGFIIACVGSAVGLGNLWKFPYITYENGGGAFFVIYLVAIVVVGSPIMLAEMLIGRRGHQNIYDTFKQLSRDKLIWKAVGLLCILTAFLILSFYSVVAGWTLHYFYHSLVGNLAELNSSEVGPYFGNFVTQASSQVGLHSLFMLLTGMIILKGTQGIERAVKILMPCLFVFILVIVGVSTTRYGFGQSFSFLFSFNFNQITSHAVLEAVGHAFFTLSLGMGVMLIYGSYLPKEVNLIKTGIWITFLDTLIALLACFMMYPIIFGTKMELKESAAMLFTTLTAQFHSLPGGQYISALFYLLVAFAALSSTISLLEPVVSFISEIFKISRKLATIIGAGAIWLLGIGCALSNGASHWFTDLAMMNKFDYFSSNWTLPIGGMMISLFAGFVLSEKDRQDELNIKGTERWYLVWLNLCRYVSPSLVLVVILFKLGLFNKL